VDDRGAKGLIYRGQQIYASGEPRMMTPSEAAEWNITT
jgi:hypothetical protein